MQGAAHKTSLFGVLRIAIWKTQKIWVTLKDCSQEQKEPGVYKDKRLQGLKDAWRELWLTLTKTENIYL